MASATPVDDEAALVAQLRAGDEAAYEQVVRTYGGRLLAVARRIVGTEEDARDVVQDAFLNAFAALPASKATPSCPRGSIALSSTPR